MQKVPGEAVVLGATVGKQVNSPEGSVPRRGGQPGRVQRTWEGSELHSPPWQRWLEEVEPQDRIQSVPSGTQEPGGTSG